MWLSFHIIYFSEDLKWHTRFAIEIFIWRESWMPFLYRVLYLPAECLKSAEFRPSNDLFLESLKSLISPLDFRIILHPVNLDIYIDYLVHYNWGLLILILSYYFSCFLSIFSCLINHFVDYFKFYLRWLPMFLRITMRLIINYCFLSWSNDSKFNIVIRFINSIVDFF